MHRTVIGPAVQQARILQPTDRRKRQRCKFPAWTPGAHWLGVHCTLGSWPSILTPTGMLAHPRGVAAAAPQRVQLLHARLHVIVQIGVIVVAAQPRLLAAGSDGNQTSCGWQHVMVTRARCPAALLHAAWSAAADITGAADSRAAERCSGAVQRATTATHPVLLAGEVEAVPGDALLVLARRMLRRCGVQLVFLLVREHLRRSSGY